MRESFVFYKSFYDAINLLGEKSQLKLYKSIMKLNFNCCETMTEIEQLCDEIETELKQNRHTFAQFLLIKPQILANFNKYLNGCKGADSGRLGGAPKGNKNAVKNNHKTTPNENEECRMSNENANENENVNVNGVAPTKKQVAEYAEQIARHIDVDMFFEYYGSSNWLDSGGLPINWKQKVIQWANRTTYKPRDATTGGLF